jgi:hypothetical protein
LHPRHCDTIFFFLADKHVLPFFTDACATARGHRGENKLPPLLRGCPGLRAEGERVIRVVPPLLVMPAIEPDWDAFLAGATAFTDAHAPLCRPFLIFFSFRSASAVLACRRGPDTGALTFTHAPV